MTGQLLCSPTNNLILPVDNLPKNEAENVTSGTIRLCNANLEKIETTLFPQLDQMSVVRYVLYKNVLIWSLDNSGLKSHTVKL